MTLPAIQLFVPVFRTEEVLAEVRECLDIGWTGLGYKTVEFETLWSRYATIAHSHFLNSATAALHLAFQLLKEQRGWDDDAEVITTPITFVSTNHAIRHSGLKPVFADVDEFLCLDPKSVISRISARTRAVCFVGVGGNTGRLTEVVEICRQHDLALILDAAHMAGSRMNGVNPGTLADITCYSFQAVKNLPTADGGMLCTNDFEIDQQARQMSWLGISKDTYSRTKLAAGNYSWYYEVNNLGYKYNGNSIMAAMGLVALKYLDLDNEKRRFLCSVYDNLFSEYAPFVERVPTAPGCESSRHLYQIRVPNRETVIRDLHSRSIYPGVHYRDNTEYPMYRYANGTCPRAHAWSNEILSLPLHLKLEVEDIRRVVTAVTEAY